MIAAENFAAGVADPAGLSAAAAQNGGGKKLRQGVLAGTFRSGYEIEVGNMVLRQALRQIFFQLVIAQKPFKGHNFPSFSTNVEL